MWQKYPHPIGENVVSCNLCIFLFEVSVSLKIIFETSLRSFPLKYLVLISCSCGPFGCQVDWPRLYTDLIQYQDLFSIFFMFQITQHLSSQCCAWEELHKELSLFSSGTFSWTTWNKINNGGLVHESGANKSKLQTDFSQNPNKPTWELDQLDQTWSSFSMTLGIPPHPTPLHHRPG